MNNEVYNRYMGNIWSQEFRQHIKEKSNVNMEEWFELGYKIYLTIILSSFIIGCVLWASCGIFKNISFVNVIILLVGWEFMCPFMLNIAVPFLKGFFKIKK